MKRWADFNLAERIILGGSTLRLEPPDGPYGFEIQCGTDGADWTTVVSDPSVIEQEWR